MAEQLAYGSSTKNDSTWVAADWQPITCGVPHGALLGPILLKILIKSLNAGQKGILSKLADDRKLEGAVDSLKGEEALQRALDK